MSDFAVSDVNTFQKITNALNSAIVGIGFVHADSVVSTTSASLIQYTGLTYTATVESGDYVIVIGRGTCSIGTAAATVAFNAAQAGTTTTNGRTVIRTFPATATDGFSTSWSVLSVYSAPTVGSTTYGIYWAKDSGSGTVYAGGATLLVLVIRPRT